MSQHFFKLIRQGETAEIASAVAADPALARSRDAQGISALLLAVYTQQPIIRDFLLTHLSELDVFEAAAVGDCDRLGAHLKRDAMLVHTASADGWPPLHLAAAFSTPEAVCLLLEHGAHVHRISQNPLRNQALNAAIALNRSLAVAALLVEAGANVNFAQAAGYTPLHQAAASGNVEIVRLLLESGADPRFCCDRGKTPIEYARERGHSEIATLLAV